MPTGGNPDTYLAWWALWVVSVQNGTSPFVAPLLMAALAKVVHAASRGWRPLSQCNLRSLGTLKESAGLVEDDVTALSEAFHSVGVALRQG